MVSNDGLAKLKRCMLRESELFGQRKLDHEYSNNLLPHVVVW